MALYHFSVKQVSRGKGQTVVNSAAYISGQKLYNDYYGQTHDYTKKSGVVFTEILTPEYVPERLTNRETLWNEVEKIEKGKRAQLAYTFDIALQNELTLDENIELARAFCREQFVARGMIVDLAVHEGKSKNEDEPDNPHFHVLAPIRPFTEEGSWGNKQRREYVLDEDGNQIKDAKGKDIFNAVSTTGWNDPELLKEWRRAWTEKVNEKFRECHMAARIDHRSYKEQGIDLIPTIHEGYEVRAMEKKGIKTVIGELNRAIRQFNQMLISLKESIQWMKTAYEEMKVELDRRQNPTLLESLQDYYVKKTQERMMRMQYTEEQIAKANQTDLVSFLNAQGEQLMKSGREYRWKKHDSVTISGNRWYRHSQSKGGYPVDFVMEFYYATFPEAVKILIGEEGEGRQKSCPAPSKDFRLPEKNEDNEKIMKYLTEKREIEKTLVEDWIDRGDIYEEKKYHNVIFVGRDADGIPRYAHCRGTGEIKYRGDITGSDKSYGFSYRGTDNQLFVFEAAIDLLSFIQLFPKDWKKRSYLSLGGVSSVALMTFLSERPQITSIFLCLEACNH